LIQLYVHKDRALTLALIRRAERLGFSALVITVDAPTVGKRLRDIRARAAADGPGAHATLGSAPRAGSSLFDERLSWSDLAWFRSVTALPLVLKGVQCGADAVLARDHGCAAIVVSNHGGRNLDGCRPTLVILDEVVTALANDNSSTRAATLNAKREQQRKMEVWVDGGVRTGADVVKALALGAHAVGIGRPAIYGMASFGQAGVEKVIEILHSEMLTTMKLMAVTRVTDITRACVDTADAPLTLASLRHML
jgi:L-lactate dehydrogenase (cytochrome)